MTTWFYDFHGLVVASAYDLPDLLPLAASEPRTAHPAVSIVPGDLDLLERLPVADYDIQVDAQDITTFLIPEGAVIALSPTGRAEVAMLPTMPDDLLRHVLIGQVLPNALVDQGLTALHASTVLCAGRVLGFVGDSGLGKSTMAAAFLAEGHQVLCDDVTPIAWQGEQACCHPGPGRLKLWPDTVAALRLGARVRRPIYHEHPKLVVDAVSGLTSPLPIAHLYQLVASQDGRLAHEPLGGAESVPLLYTNIFGHRRPSARARATHFAQTTRLAYSGLLSLVHLPRALERLPEVVRFLAAT